MRVLVSDPLDPAAVARVRSAGHEVIEKSFLKGAALIEALRGCQGLLVRGATRVTAEVLRGSPELKVVVRAGTGLDNIDGAVARECGVAVMNTPGANAISVAELVFGLLLALERHLVPASGDLARGVWEKAKYGGRELKGRSLGLLGFGRIGREVALRARGFGMTVMAHDPLIETWPHEFGWVRCVPFDELLAGADILSLHVPLTPETRGRIGARELGRMRKDSILVNCARGGVVDESALLAALESGALSGVALDVFETEPPPAGLPLLGHPRVIATPHLGAATVEAQTRAGMEAAEILIDALARVSV